MPAVSVLLPVRDAASTLPAALESVLGQTLPDLEVVVADDGSTDGSTSVVETFARRDARVRLLRRPARGLVTALNAGLEECRAPLVARMDADDLCDRDRLAVQAAFLAARPELGVAGCLVAAERIDGAPVTHGMARYLAWQNAVREPHDIARQRFIESPLVHPSIVARRSVLLEAGGYREGPFPEDYDLWLRLLAAGVRLAKVDRVLLTWRDHGGRATRTDRRYAPERFRALKVAHLQAGPLASGPPVIVWGAGLEGKALIRELRAAGIPVPFAVEVDPGKIGQQIHGARVIDHAGLEAALAALPGAIVLVAVGVPGARAPIRAALDAQRLEEGASYYFLC